MLTSDVSAYSQILLEGQFETLALEGPEWIVDCGANVGCSSLYFLDRWPNCKVIAIEADPQNFPLLVKNLSSYGDRALPVLAAVVDRSGHIGLTRRPERGHWSTQVSDERAQEDEVCVPAVSLHEIIGWVPGGRIDFLKIDIEESETPVMRWIARNPATLVGTLMAVELHNEEARAALDELTDIRRSGVTTTGEYVLVNL